MLIGIAGGTGSGKTTVAHKILERLPSGEATLIEHDWYYRDHPDLPFEEKGRLNFDEPAALESSLLIRHLIELKAGRPIECPQYDFATHSRKAETRRITPCRIIVVEGILTFAVPDLCALFDLRLFIDTDDDIRLMRRIKRDITKRGRDIGSIQDQYYSTVRPMHRLHVAPSKDHAHLIVPEGGENQAALDVIVGCLLYGLTTWP